MLRSNGFEVPIINPSCSSDYEADWCERMFDHHPLTSSGSESSYYWSPNFNSESPPYTVTFQTSTDADEFGMITYAHEHSRCTIEKSTDGGATWGAAVEV